MRTFYVDFAGYCEIEAESKEEAEEKFWELIYENKALPQNSYGIENIERKVE